MKMITLLSVMTVATLASAQTNTATTNTTANTVAQSASTNAKKAAKKTVKKANKATAAKNNNATEQKGSATVTTETTSQAPQINNSSANTANSSAAIAAGSSTTAVAAESKPKSGLKLKIANEAEVSSEEVMARTSESTISNTSHIAVSYKFNDKLTIGAKQYMESKYQATNAGDDNGGKLTATQVVASTSVSGIMGSKDIKPALSYYLPTNAFISSLERGNKLTQSLTGFYGIARLDAMIDWEINKNLTFGLYLNPRQQFAKDQILTTEKPNILKQIENVSRLNQSLNLTYTINDNISPYTYAGYDLSIGNTTGYAIKEVSTLGLGVEMSFMNGLITVSPEVYSENLMRKEGNVASVRFLSPETITYYLATALSF